MRAFTVTATRRDWTEATARQVYFDRRQAVRVAAALVEANPADLIRAWVKRVELTEGQLAALAEDAGREDRAAGRDAGDARHMPPLLRTPYLKGYFGTH